MEYYDLSAASFADKIEVGRSSISHLLSGRNKPSLDFVMKIIKAFPEVELYWLLNGRGTFPKKETEPAPSSTRSRSTSKDLFSEEKESQDETANLPPPERKNETKKEIKKIVFFYTDGSFEAFDH